MTARSAADPSSSHGDGAFPPDGGAFGGSRACFEDVVGWLEDTEAGSLSPSELEDVVDRRGRQLLRRLLQDHLDLRARREERVEVMAVGGVTYGSVEPGHTRQLATVFGALGVEDPILGDPVQPQQRLGLIGGHLFQPPPRHQEGLGHHIIHR